MTSRRRPLSDNVDKLPLTPTRHPKPVLAGVKFPCDMKGGMTRRLKNLVSAWMVVLVGLSLSPGCGDVSREGTYSGSDDAFVRVMDDKVVELRLVYKGNSGLLFASGRLNIRTQATIGDGSFQVTGQGEAVVTGTFVDGNRKIKGTWSDDGVTGTWSAGKD